LDPDEFQPLHGWPCLVRAVQTIEVEVDPETGMVDVVNGAAAHDCGKAFYPEGLDQENFGGWLQGTSRVGMEEQIYDPQTGVQLTDNLIGYPISIMNDYAHPISHIVETGGGYGAYGAAGNGETPGALAQSPILVAVQNALGVWVDAPVTPMRILKALGKG
jgi:CO/xanthine dehydrogenase Mo-binding subunit